VIGEGIVKEDGTRDGHWKEYYLNGILQAEGDYRMANGGGMEIFLSRQQTGTDREICCYRKKRRVPGNGILKTGS